MHRSTDQPPNNSLNRTATVPHSGTPLAFGLTTTLPKEVVLLIMILTGYAASSVPSFVTGAAAELER